MPEIIRSFQYTRPPRVSVIDFDGTLSLIRAGWVEIMLDMIVDVLRPLPGTHETDEKLTELVSDFVLDLTGRPTIFQMDFLVKTAKERGGNPESPEYYTQKFLDALVDKARQRIRDLKAGKIGQDDLLVPGARALLADLQQRGVQLTLASGTPVDDVRREAQLLGIDHFFAGRIYGPGADSREFSKMKVMRQTLADAHAEGSQLLGIGDGFVEIQNASELGAIAIGCASDENHRSGRVEEWKRTRLIRAGAHIIVPDYSNRRELVELLFADRF